MIWSEKEICRCPICDGEIYTGDEVVEVGNEMVHVDCARTEKIALAEMSGNGPVALDDDCACDCCGCQMKKGDMAFFVGKKVFCEDCFCWEVDFDEMLDGFGLCVSEASVDDGVYIHLY